MLLKSQVSRIKCGICSETFNSENHFKVHSENKHKEISGLLDNPEVPRDLGLV